MKTTTTTGSTNTNQNNSGANITQKTGWIQTCVRNYIGCILTAIRDRNNDYLKVLFALAPKVETTNTNNKNDNGAPETEDNTPVQ